MSDSPSRNLTLQLGDFGPLVVQPEEASEDEIGRARYVIFPDRIPDEAFAAALDWAAMSQAPIFCTAHDLKRFEQEGFGAYRFNALGGFRELGFEAGSLRFIPARRKQASGLRGVWEDLSDAWGWSRRESFHVAMRSPSEGSTLYLATPFVDKGDWAMLTEDKPQRIFGSPLFGRLYWTALAEKLGVNIEILEKDENSVSAFSKIFGVRDDAGSSVPRKSNVVNQGAPRRASSWKSAGPGSGS